MNEKKTISNTVISILAITITLSGFFLYLDRTWAENAVAGVDVSDRPFAIYAQYNHDIIKSNPFSGNIYAISSATTMPTITLQPVAEPGWDQVAKSNELFELDASRSTDPDNLTLSYAWTQVMGPHVVLDDHSSEKPKFIAPKTNEKLHLTFQLIVSNQKGATSDPDYVTVFVSPKHPAPAISTPVNE
jgi:hypothetical protein